MSATPTKAAISLTKVWRATHEKSEWFPVNCREIAAGLGMRVNGESMDPEFQGALFLEDGLKAILYNEDIKEEERKNCTIGHELGHYSLHKDRRVLRCSMADLNDFSSGPHPANIEQEANAFAAMLLMPPDDFRTQVKGKRPTLGMLGNIANFRYGTTLTATAIRLIELSSEPVALVRFHDQRVEWVRKSAGMRKTGLWLNKGEKLAPEARAGNRDGDFIETWVWLDEHHAERWEFFQSVVDMPSYGRTLVLLHGSSR